MYLQSNLYKTTTLGTTQKWLSWKGGHLIKNLCQATTKFVHSCQVLVFFNGECFTRSKVLVFWCHSWRLNMFSVTFDFECTYIKEVQYNCSAHCSAQLFIIAISSHSHKNRRSHNFFFNFFPTFTLNTERY